MKSKIYKAGITPFLLGAVIIGLGFASCKKDGYRTDGGLAKATTTQTTYDYLAGNAYHYFDTLLLIVDHFNLKDSLNKSGTFFAPTDYAIHLLMTTNSITSLNALYKRINTKFLTQYMFSDTGLTLNGATTAVQTYTSWAGDTAGLTKLAGTYGVANSVLTYYTLEYVKINGVLDGSAGAPSNDPTDLKLKCQTTGIKTATGTNLNVLDNASTLNLHGAPTSLSLSYSVNVTQSATDYNSTDVQLDSAKIASFLGLTAAQIGDSIQNGSTNVLYYEMATDSTLSNNYTADFPGFWLDNQGNVTTWGTNSYMWIDLNTTPFTLTVGQYPGGGSVGDKYTYVQVFVYTNPDGVKLKVYITINVTLI
ncbi:MAG TPA: DUF4859 domain-containing protein [Puia sp.]|nr:DUF4859 domain-containing protein [Puia sp.]